MDGMGLLYRLYMQSFCDHSGFKHFQTNYKTLLTFTDFLRTWIHREPGWGVLIGSCSVRSFLNLEKNRISPSGQFFVTPSSSNHDSQWKMEMSPIVFPIVVSFKSISIFPWTNPPYLGRNIWVLILGPNENLGAMLRPKNRGTKISLTPPENLLP